MKNVTQRVFVCFVLVTLSLLSACSGGFSAAPYSFDVALDPSPLGWSIDDAGKITVPTTILTFNSKAGAVGATLEGYEIEYLESSGNNAFPGDSIQNSKGTLNVRVPPGIRCPAGEGGAITECTVNTVGVVFARGEPASSAPTQMLPISIIGQLQDLISAEVGGAVGATANVTFYGTDDLQREFVSKAYQFAIVAPL